MAIGNLTILLFITIAIVFYTEASHIIYGINDAETRQTNDTTCLCKGNGCMCCVSFNFSYVALGGPGCVEAKYISQEQGVSLNVSYGEKLIHTNRLTGPNDPPTCMELMEKVVQICARFSVLEPHNDGLRGCLAVQPKVLNEIQTEIDISCFIMNEEGMKIERTEEDEEEEEEEDVPDEDQAATEEPDYFSVLNDEAIYDAVKETAQKGLVFFSNYFGIDLKTLAANVTSTKENEDKGETS